MQRGACQSGCPSGAGSGSTYRSWPRQGGPTRGRQQSLLVDQCAAGDVDECSVGLHRGELGRTDEPGGLVGRRGRKNDDIGVGSTDNRSATGTVRCAPGSGSADRRTIELDLERGEQTHDLDRNAPGTHHQHVATRRGMFRPSPAPNWWHEPSRGAHAARPESVPGRAPPRARSTSSLALVHSGLLLPAKRLSVDANASTPAQGNPAPSRSPDATAGDQRLGRFSRREPGSGLASRRRWRHDTAR